MTSTQEQCVTDVLLQVKSARFEPRFTYAIPNGANVKVGDVVHVPLGKKFHYGYVVREPYTRATDERTKPLQICPEIPNAFSVEMLSLAEWLAAYYCCSLTEALSTMVPSSTMPRMVERIVPGDRALADGLSTVSSRLVDLLWNDFSDGTAAEELLRHPEARRTGDRGTLRRMLRSLIESGAVLRSRIAIAPAIRERTVRVLHVGGNEARGKKAQALRAMVDEHGELFSADAALAGFSRAVIVQAVRAGAVSETSVVVHAQSRNAKLAPQRFEATVEQATAIEQLRAASAGGAFADVLLYGITGSGKTFVYLEFIRKLVERGESAIVLVPEIALTPQTAQRFEAIFGDQVVVLHSALSDRERFESRLAAARGDVRVVVGARSAVFTPIPHLRAIIIDEAHETSYKQDAAPRYNAITVARERMRRANGVLVLGSATPPLEEYARAKLGRSQMLVLRDRATHQPLPATTVVDMTKEPKRHEETIFSVQLLAALERCLARGEKTMLFVNRRGTASFVLCRACAFVPRCRRCSLSLTYHAGEGLLRCHLCDAQERMHDRCPRCAQAPFRPFGIGTQRVVDELEDLFPQARVIRMDSDTTTRVGDHARLLSEFEYNGDILVGTQMIAKGLDFEAVTLAAVLAADIGLHFADYRASERTFDLLTQVAGRSGRAQAGEAIIQTYLPEHSAIVFSAAHDFEGFARGELIERRALAYPPFSKLTYIGVIGRNREHAQHLANEVAAVLRKAGVGEVLGPSFYPVARMNDEWRLRVAVKSANYNAMRIAIREHLLPLQKKANGIRLAINFDP